MTSKITAIAPLTSTDAIPTDTSATGSAERLPGSSPVQAALPLPSGTKGFRSLTGHLFAPLEGQGNSEALDVLVTRFERALGGGVANDLPPMAGFGAVLGSVSPQESGASAMERSAPLAGNPFLQTSKGADGPPPGTKAVDLSDTSAVAAPADTEDMADGGDPFAAGFALPIVPPMVPQAVGQSFSQAGAHGGFQPSTQRASERVSPAALPEQTQLAPWSDLRITSLLSASREAAPSTLLGLALPGSEVAASALSAGGGLGAEGRGGDSVFQASAPNLDASPEADGLPQSVPIQARHLAEESPELAAALAASALPPAPIAPLGLLADAPSVPSPRAAEAAWQQVQAMALQFAAGIGREGVHQVRLEIDPRLLPGVQVVMQVLAGQVQLEFICANEQSRRRLREVAQREVGSMAERLGRSVQVSLRGVEANEVGNLTDGQPEFMHASA